MSNTYMNSHMTLFRCAVCGSIKMATEIRLGQNIYVQAKTVITKNIQDLRVSMHNGNARQ